MAEQSWKREKQRFIFRLFADRSGKMVGHFEGDLNNPIDAVAYVSRTKASIVERQTRRQRPNMDIIKIRIARSARNLARNVTLEDLARESRISHSVNYWKYRAYTISWSNCSLQREHSRNFNCNCIEYSAMWV